MTEFKSDNRIGFEREPDSALRRLALATLILLACLMLSACGNEPTVEQQIIASLESMEADAEEGRFLDFMQHVSRDFKGQQGALSRQDFQRYLMIQVNETRRIYANFFPIRVEGKAEVVGEPRATASFKLLVTGGKGLLPERGRLLDVKTGWVREGGEWLLTSADWEVATSDD